MSRRAAIDESPAPPTRRPPVRGTHTLHDDTAARVARWFEAQGLRPTTIQSRVFEALGAPGPLLVTAPTGSGKTAAVMLPLLAAMDAARDVSSGVRCLYLAPVRALVDGHTVRLRALVEGLGARLRVEARTGDTSAHQRAKLRRSPPDVLVTTPETLAVVLGGEGRAALASVTHVVLDEAHALAAGKRGALLGATLATLDAYVTAQGHAAPRRVAVSATANPLHLLAAWVAPGTRVVAAGDAAPPALELADPTLDDAFPSAGWTWRAALPAVARAVATGDGSALVFVSARARAEHWTLALRDILPARVTVACYHGSLSAEARGAVAQGLEDRSLRVVVATSGLEAGVDLPAVSRVLVVSAPPAVTRLVQAAGRADHRPGAAPRATLVATTAMDLVRCRAALTLAARGELEPVELREGDLDVAAQAALGRVALGPCTRDEIASTLRAAWAWRHLTDDDVDAVLDYLATGGDGLAAYPELARVVTDGERWALAGRRSLRRYLQCAGTLVGDVAVPVRHGANAVGQVEGRFAAMLDVGDRFVLAARTWRVASLSSGEIQVRPDRGQRSTVPSWAGARAPQSELLGAACEALWGALDGDLDAGGDARAAVAARLGAGEGNTRAVLRLLRAQRAASRVPSPRRFVVERVREGARLTVVAFTFAGATANELIARVAAARARDASGAGAEVAATDECAALTLTARDTPDEEALRGWFAPEGLAARLGDTLEGGVLAAAYFREVARVAQLWAPERARGTVTPGLLYDVLRKYGPRHVLLRALEHTLWTALEGPRAERCLAERARRPWCVVDLDGPSAMAIPVFAWARRDAVQPDDPESALAAAAHSLFLRAAALAGD